MILRLQPGGAVALGDYDYSQEFDVDLSQFTGGGTDWSNVFGSGAAGGITAGVTVGAMTGSVKRGAIAGAGAALLSVAPFTGPAAPFLAVAGGLVTAFSTMFKGCGDTCVASTQIANKATEAADQLLAAYRALPSPRPKSAQVGALAALDDIAATLAAGCSNPALGAAGKRCLEERLVRGGTAPWCPTPDHRGCDWYAMYRDPIANDTAVYNDEPLGMVSEALASAGVGGRGLDLGIVLALGLLAAGVLL